MENEKEQKKVADEISGDFSNVDLAYSPIV